MRLSARARTLALFTVVVLTCALGSLSQTVMNAMLAGVEADFGCDESVSQWVTSIYMLVIGVVVPLVAFLSQRLSVKNLTFLALGFFAAGSALCLAAPGFGVLLAGRVLQAVATGITLPLLQSIAMTRFAPGQIGTAMGVAGIAMGFAPNIGPLVGGVLVDSLGWRSFFAIMLVVLAALAACCALLVEREEVPVADATLDLPSFMLSCLGFGGLLLCFTNAASMPPAELAVWVPLMVGVVCLVVFVRRQNRIECPLVSMRIFESPDFRASFVAQNCLFASFMGITLVVPLFVQSVCGGSAVDAGVVFVPATILAIVFNPLAGIVSDKVGRRPVLVFAGVCLSVGAASMVFVGESTPLWLLTAMQTVRGIGVSSSIGPLINWGMSSLPGERMMDGSVFFTTVRQACASFGTALMMLAVSAASAFTLPAAADYQLAFALSAVLSLVMLATVLVKAR